MANCMWNGEYTQLALKTILNTTSEFKTYNMHRVLNCVFTWAIFEFLNPGGAPDPAGVGSGIPRQ